MKKIPYGKQQITDADIKSVVNTLQSELITQGPKVKEFEEKFAEYVGSKYAIAVSNGTTALHLCALALELNASSKVITTPITFAASANCIRYCGGEVVFADIDPDNLVLDVNKVRSLLEATPKGTYAGIIPVDFAGYPVDLEAFRKLADEFGLWIIEDACHAPGGYFTDTQNIQQRCGNGVYADLSVFSFHPVKHIACGEGGMITTNKEDLYQRLCLLRTHGITKDPAALIAHHGPWYYEMQELGYNYRLPDILCALGISQLGRAQENIEKRRAIAARYDQAFQDTPIRIYLPKAGVGHAYHLYVIHVAQRKEMYLHLKSKGIFAQIHYIPVHKMPYYQKINRQELPLSESYYQGCISLPMYPNLTEEEQDFVIDTVKEFVACEV